MPGISESRAGTSTITIKYHHHEYPDMHFNNLNKGGQAMLKQQVATHRKCGNLSGNLTRATKSVVGTLFV